MNIEYNKSLKNFNTFGVDVKAANFITVTTLDEMKESLLLPDVKTGRWLVIGGGSNILFTKDFDGTVILNRIKGVEIIRENADYVWIKAGGGEVWHDLVMWCVERNFGGIENLALIPGCAGAAPIQNIGAYGAEIKDVIDKAEMLMTDGKTLINFSNAECKFGYRESIFKNQLKGKGIITSIELRLKKKPEINISYGAIRQELEKAGIKNPGIKEVCEAVINIRKSKLPDPQVLGNAGSFFKNPEIEKKEFDDLKIKFAGIPGFEQPSGKVKVPAGWLIEQCGLKGIRRGNTGTHKDQALVIVNYGNASGSEILEFAEFVAAEVNNKFGITLEKEVNVI
jgi:UDP-N-acetylmuramate dehydrogenase